MRYPLFDTDLGPDPNLHLTNHAESSEKGTHRLWHELVSGSVHSLKVDWMRRIFLKFLTQP